MILIKLFYEFLKIGAFSFGGGMSTLPYIYEMSNRTNWISEEYICNLLSVTQVTPGPIACNIGTIVGYKVSGIAGAFVTNIGFIIPATIFMGIIYKFFDKIQKNEKIKEIIKIIRAASLALVITSSVTLFKTSYLNENNLIDYKSIIFGIILLIFYKKKKINTLFFILISAALAGLLRV